MINELLKAYMECCLHSLDAPTHLNVSPDFMQDLLRVAAEQLQYQCTAHRGNIFMGLPVKVVDDLDVPYEFVFDIPATKMQNDGWKQRIGDLI